MGDDPKATEGERSFQVPTFSNIKLNFQTPSKKRSAIVRMLKIKISYCGGWGYAPKSQKLKGQLESKFSGKIEVIEDKIPGNTGFFEVELENGEVLHSKKNGDGYVDTPNKLEKIMSGVENALKWYYWNNEYFIYLCTYNFSKVL